MVDLILWRHAEAADGATDHARELTAKGIKQAEKVAAFLHRHLPDDARILVSPATRAQQTAAALTTRFTLLKPDARIRRGIAFMSELGVFPGLSISENLRMGGYFLDAAEVRRRAEPLYALFPDLARRRREPAASLSGGQRKMLGLAKALMAAPALLIMDEPSAGLAP